MDQTIVTDEQAAEIGKEIVTFYRSLMNDQAQQIHYRIQAAIQLEPLVFDFEYEDD